MKIIQNSITAILFFLLFLSLPAYGQKNLDDQFDMKLTQVRKDKDKVYFEGTVLLKDVNVSSKNQLTITPEVRGVNGESKSLLPVIVNGKTRNKLYKRWLKLQGIKEDSNAQAVLDINSRDLKRPINYRASTTYEAWMKNAKVYAVVDLCGCNGSNKDNEEKLIWPTVDLDKYGPKGSFIVPETEKLKNRAETGEAYVRFEQAKWVIHPHLFNNREELAKIDRSLRYIREEPTAVITKISIKAYASPEGTYENNMILSKNRAKALLDYIKLNHTIPSNVIVFSEGYGEDWDRLVPLIEGDPRVENKNQILNIIRTVSIFDGRESQIMAISGGRPYKYMLENLFPFLRRSDYQIEYAVPEFSREKSMQMLNTKPNMLSLEEIYRTVDTEAVGSEKYNHAYKVAAETFPTDPVACINASSIAIMEKDYATAKRLLQNWKNEPRAWNNLAIVAMSEIRLDEAEQYLVKAQAAGIKEASANMAILRQLKDAAQLHEGSGY